VALQIFGPWIGVNAADQSHFHADPVSCNKFDDILFCNSKFTLNVGKKITDLRAVF
jgi:hypothetical protein